MTTHSAMPGVQLPSGEAIPALGQGTWHMAEDPRHREDEIRALRTGLDLGMTLIDTAELYSDGASETLVGTAIQGRRDEVFLVSKVLPSNATTVGTVQACHQSLRRLGTDHLDLYLLHWRGRIPLAETLAGFSTLTRAGTIRYWGVSNFDVRDLEELVGLPGGEDVQVNQVLYNLSRRGPEFDLLPWSQDRGIVTMAYSPVEQGRLLTHPAISDVASRHAATPAQVALAWVLRRPGINAVPKAGTPAHVLENRASLAVHLTEGDLRQLDAAFPPPVRKERLAML
jgi:diketogulonate reductase-like aldo/keto reductase